MTSVTAGNRSEKDESDWIKSAIDRLDTLRTRGEIEGKADGFAMANENHV